MGFSCRYKYTHTSHGSSPPWGSTGDHLAFHRFGEGLGECMCHWRSHQCPARREVSFHLSSATATHPCTKSPAVCGYQPGRGTHRTPGGRVRVGELLDVVGGVAKVVTFAEVKADPDSRRLNKNSGW